MEKPYHDMEIRRRVMEILRKELFCMRIVVAFIRSGKRDHRDEEDNDEEGISSFRRESTG